MNIRNKNNKLKCPRGYAMSTQGVCAQSLGGQSTLGGVPGNSCADQCYNFYTPLMGACADYSGNVDGYCPGYCDGYTICTDCLDFGIGECHTCIQQTTYCTTHQLTQQMHSCIQSCAGQGAWIGKAAAPSPKDWRRGGRINRLRRRR